MGELLYLRRKVSSPVRQKLVKLRRNNPQFARGEHYFYNDVALYQSRNTMLFSRNYKRIFSLVALNFGRRNQVVPFQFPFNGNYREELHGLENLIEVSKIGKSSLEFPASTGGSEL
jgi:hypothetical protein